MISKCQNVVINRTKFSDFENFDTEEQSTDKLNLVGFVETQDALGNTISKNISVKYPSDLSPRINNIEKIIGINSFENIDPACCENKIECSIACKLSEFESDIKDGFDNVTNLKDEFEVLKGEINDAKAEVFFPQENTIFVHSSLDENGYVELRVAEIMDRYGSPEKVNSTAWSLVIVTAVKASDKMIYPEITYSGEAGKDGWDTRKIAINNKESGIKDVVVVLSAVRNNSNAIISI